MKSLRMMIMTAILGITLLGSFGFWFLANKFSRSALNSMVENEVQQVATAVSSSVFVENMNKFQLMEKLSAQAYIQDPNVSLGKKMDELDAISNASSDLVGLNYTDLNGNSRTRETGYINFGEKAYIKAALKGEGSIVGPVANTVSGTLTMIYALPVKDTNQKITGAMFLASKGEILCDTVKNYQVGKTGYPIIIDRNTGKIIGDVDVNNVINGVNLYEMAKNDKNLSTLVPFMEDLMKGNSGKGYYSNNGVKVVCGYAPIDRTNWAVLCGAPYVEYSGEIEKMNVILLVIAGILIVIGGVVSVFVALAIKPLKTVGDAINEIASGNADLTRRLTIKKTKTEIKQVVDGFNAFVQKLQEIIISVKSSGRNLMEAENDLKASTQDASASIVQIMSNIDGVDKQIIQQVQSVQETVGAVNQVTANIGSLENMIETQASGVTEASAAVEEMVGNINSVNQSVDKMVNSFKLLQVNTNTGIQTQSEVNERVTQIEEQSKMLQDANSAIANIASQTNLLAMNAAIEAAHAGEAGKGFSVVADEIRKLSETSSAQSRTIGDELTKIRDSIGSVVDASSRATSAFQSVSESITSTDEIIQQIKGAMDEQQVGSRQITEALRAMNDSTTEVRAASQEMNTGSKHILSEVEKLQETTSIMKDSVMEMSTGATKINESGSALTTISGNVSTAVAAIRDQVRLFKTE